MELKFESCCISFERCALGRASEGVAALSVGVVRRIAPLAVSRLTAFVILLAAFARFSLSGFLWLPAGLDFGCLSGIALTGAGLAALLITVGLSWLGSSCLGVLRLALLEGVHEIGDFVAGFTT